MNEEEKKETQVYSIPGVIIPEQTTDSGVVIKTENTDVYQNQGEETKEQIADSSKVEQISNTTPDNVYKEPEKEVIDTNIEPIMPGMMPEEKKEETKPLEKPKKVKKEGNAKVGMLEVIIIVLTIVVLYFVYITYINPPKVSSDDYKALNKQVFNKKGFVTTELYDWINLSGCNSLNSSLYNSSDVIRIGDLKDEEKLYLAYLQIKNKNISEVSCSSYSPVLHSNSKNANWYCGSSFGVDDTKSLTKMIDSKILKSQVLRMFGQGEYKEKTFNINDGSRYFYNSNSDSYILQTSDATTTCNNISTKLISVETSDNEIILNISVKFDTGEETRRVRFIKSSDGNYYFDQISKS